MAQKEHMMEQGATTACVLRLVNGWAGTGLIINCASWFSSVKSAVQLKKVGLYSNDWENCTQDQEVMNDAS